jgi:hypothetical protein
MSDEAKQILTFRIRAVAGQTADDVRAILDEEVAMAVSEASDVDRATADLPGAFGGVGETIAIVIAILKVAGGAAGKGAAAAAGKYFFDTYVKPRLQKRNLQVSDATVKSADDQQK